MTNKSTERNAPHPVAGDTSEMEAARQAHTLAQMLYGQLAWPYVWTAPPMGPHAEIDPRFALWTTMSHPYWSAAWGPYGPWGLR
jgi:hypothetical protein